MVSVLFVCLGNICRSPTAEGVFRKCVEDANLNEVITIDSAGTSNWHIGKSPDSRSIKAASNRSVNLAGLRARQVSQQDFSKFDYILPMDNANLSALQELKPSASQTTVKLFLSYQSHKSPFDHTEVPDPYYEGEEGFELVLDLVERASEGLLADIRNRYSL